MKTIITSAKEPPLRRVLCSFLFGAAAFFVVPAYSQAPRDIVWVVTGGNTIAAYYANGTALPGFNLITLQSWPPPGGIRVSGGILYVPWDNWACCPNKGYTYALFKVRAYYMFTYYFAATGSVYIPGFIGAGRAPPFVATGMTQSGPIYVASQGFPQGIAKGDSPYPSIKSTVMQAPYALAVGEPNGNVLYVTNNAQNSNGKFYISTYTTAGNGALLVPYFIEIQTGGLYGLALKNNVFGVNSALYVSVYSGNAPGVYPGVYIYDATTGKPIQGAPSFPVNEPWGIAIEGNTLYVASHQDSAIYEFDATKGGPHFGSIKLSAAPTNITVEPY